MSSAQALDWDGWYRIDIGEADIDFAADVRTARLEIDFEQCREETGGCQAGTVTIRADSGTVQLTSRADGSTHLDVSGATIEARFGPRVGSCDGLVNFAATVKTIP
jgi:hypothetical protein